MQSSDHDLLVRMDERTKTMATALNTFVTKKEFAPVRAIVYGMTSLILISVIGAIITLVVRR